MSSGTVKTILQSMVKETEIQVDRRCETTILWSEQEWTFLAQQEQLKTVLGEEGLL